MSELTQRQELGPKNKKFIQIEAPERLEAEQNLYDQEPFLSLLKSISQSTGQTPSKLRTAISLIAKVHSMAPKLEPTELLRKADVSRRTKRSILWNTQVKILEVLQMYPYLSEYIQLQRQNRLYALNGNPAPSAQRPKDYQPPSSYANWVTQKLEIEKRSWLVGIKEVFPRNPKKMF